MATEENLRRVEAAEQEAGGDLAEHILEERLRFEQLLSNLSSRFVKISPDRVDSEIEESLRQILEFFAVDRAALLHLVPHEAAWRITHDASSGVLPRLTQGTSPLVSVNPLVYET